MSNLNEQLLKQKADQDEAARTAADLSEIHDSIARVDALLTDEKRNRLPFWRDDADILRAARVHFPNAKIVEGSETAGADHV